MNQQDLPGQAPFPTPSPPVPNPTSSKITPEEPYPPQQDNEQTSTPQPPSQKKSFQCHYTTLGVDPSASPKDITRAYRSLAVQYHPDRAEGCVQQANERFLLLKEAYQVLSCPQQRPIYDQARAKILRQLDRIKKFRRRRTGRETVRTRPRIGRIGGKRGLTLDEEEEPLTAVDLFDLLATFNSQGGPGVNLPFSFFQTAASGQCTGEGGGTFFVDEDADDWVDDDEGEEEEEEEEDSWHGQFEYGDPWFGNDVGFSDGEEEDGDDDDDSDDEFFDDQVDELNGQFIRQGGFIFNGKGGMDPFGSLFQEVSGNLFDAFFPQIPKQHKSRFQNHKHHHKHNTSRKQSSTSKVPLKPNKSQRERSRDQSKFEKKKANFKKSNNNKSFKKKPHQKPSQKKRHQQKGKKPLFPHNKNKGPSSHHKQSHKSKIN